METTHKESMSAAEFIELAVNNQLPNLWNVGVTLVKGDVKFPPKFACENLDLSNYVFDGSLEFKEVKMESLIFNVFVSLEQFKRPDFTGVSGIKNCLVINDSEIGHICFDNCKTKTLAIRRSAIGQISLNNSEIEESLFFIESTVERQFSAIDTKVGDVSLKGSKFNFDVRLDNMTIKSDFRLHGTDFTKYVFCKGMTYRDIYAEKRIIDFITYSQQGKFCSLSDFK